VNISQIDCHDLITSVRPLGTQVGGVTDGFNEGTKSLKAHNEGLIKKSE
jgi:hypothetical protein